LIGSHRPKRMSCYCVF